MNANKEKAEIPASTSATLRTYQVEVTEVLQRTLYIEAETEEAAIAEAKYQYKDEDVVLDYSDLIETSFQVTSVK